VTLIPISVLQTSRKVFLEVWEANFVQTVFMVSMPQNYRGSHPHRVGGHLDSWDVGGGAHDDGAGCVQAMEVLHTMIKMNYTPKRTIRCVLFMNEENGLAGGLSYAKWSNENKEFHLAAIESDAGGFTPLGFNFDADSSMVKSYAQALGKWSELLEPYDLKISKGGSGADIGPLKSQKGLLVGLSPDSQRYFEYHHTEADRIKAVHPRELSLGTAAMASLIGVGGRA